MSYEDFIEGIKPETIDNRVTYEVKDGIFKRLALLASKEISKIKIENASDQKVLLFDDAWNKLIEETQESIENGSEKSIYTITNKELEIKTKSEHCIRNLEKIDSKEKQIHFIIDKIKNDSIIEFKNISDKIVLKVNKDENVNDAIIRQSNQSKCKILFVLSQKKTGHLLDLNKYPHYSAVLKYLTNETINSIEILEDEKATSLYGSRAICGVVILKSDDKKLRRLIKKSLRKQKTKG